MLGILAIGGVTALVVGGENPTVAHHATGPATAIAAREPDADDPDLLPRLHPLPSSSAEAFAASAAPSHAAPTLAASPRQIASRTVPRPAAGAHPHIMVIMEENKGYAATLGSCAADPYWCSLAATYASDTSWFGIGHPSAPNYVAIASGGTQGVSSDCTPPGCGPFNVPSLGGQLTGAGIPWVSYMESMPSPCYSGGSAGLYAEKHNPFLYFNDVRAAANCSSVVQPYPGVGGLLATLNGPAAPDFVWVTPNLADDMHDGTVQQGDAWLRANLAPVLASPWFTAGNSTVIVTMDENDAQSSPGGGQVPMVVISNNARGKGAVAIAGNHYGTLGSIERAYGLGLLGGAASGSSGDLVSLFG